MSQLAINKCKNPETTSQTFLEQLKGITDSTRDRASSIFQNRNRGMGSDGYSSDGDAGCAWHTGRRQSHSRREERKPLDAPFATSLNNQIDGCWSSCSHALGKHV